MLIFKMHFIFQSILLSVLLRGTELEHPPLVRLFKNVIYLTLEHFYYFLITFN